MDEKEGKKHMYCTEKHRKHRKYNPARTTSSDYLLLQISAYMKVTDKR